LKKNYKVQVFKLPFTNEAADLSVNGDGKRDDDALTTVDPTARGKNFPLVKFLLLYAVAVPLLPLPVFPTFIFINGVRG